MEQLEKLVGSPTIKYLSSSRASKDHKVSEVLKNFFKEIEKLEGEVSEEEKPQFYLLIGRTLNQCYNPPTEAETYLMKAAKLSKTSVDAWNELGEYYWNKGDVSSAKTIFAAALEKVKNSVSLRNLSTVYRHLPVAGEEDQLNNWNQSLLYAKEAISLDMSDGKSWSTLGNLYLHLYGYTQDISNLNSSVNAYRQAEKDPVCSKDSDFALNYGNILKAAEQYQEAIEWYDVCETLDPESEFAIGHADVLFRSLKAVEEHVLQMGKLKQKKIHSLIQGLKNQDSKHNFKIVPVNALEEGINRGKAVQGCVVANSHISEGVPRCLTLAVDASQAVNVSLYNTAKEFPVKIGERILVPDPDFKMIEASRKGKSLKYPSIRVENPRKILFNGKSIPEQFIVPCQVRAWRPNVKTDTR
ncbi:tetratricopeptide repeat protein 5-like [Artemia franciscana]|uniref:Tetratricopeptide repeat protein 5 OB fold domain-containing protein n=1 Tax=Artemia franciscana TaxID=6661 RepID=A0AA88I9G9_ARTSF|nr:hypothetical protein QYM36_001038 [Artemia franciscana]